jgi:hypothetical protein
MLAPCNVLDNRGTWLIFEIVPNVKNRIKMKRNEMRRYIHSVRTGLAEDLWYTTNNPR